MAATVVFDLDKVLLGGDASTLFLHGRIRLAPRRLLLLLLAAPLLIPGSLIPQTRPLAARIMTRIAVGGDPGSDVEAVAAAYGEALSRKPEAAVADALACVREHRARGEVVVVATGCEETLARGFLAAVGLGDLDVVGSTGRVWPPRVARAMGESKVAMLVQRGYPRRGLPRTATARRTCRCSAARRDRSSSTPTSRPPGRWSEHWAAVRTPAPGGDPGGPSSP